ncbi:MAG TPA: MmgE/PrpD family protein [bacterium]|nr:MmgE/PrpD family protein [bacterium]
MTGVTERLAAYAGGLRYEDLPAGVVARVKDLVLDTLGTLLGGARYPAGRLVTRYTEGLGESGPCTVAGSALRVSPVAAAFANATMSHCLEQDDNYNPANAHVANVVLPAALAIGEADHAGGRELIASLVAAYDVEGRVGIALDPVRLYARSFHPSSIDGNFGAAAAAGRMLRLQPAAMVDAFGLAGCQASGLLAWVTEASQLSKAFQIGIASRNGVTAAQLAHLGFTGPPHILEGKHNLFRAFSGLEDDQAAVLTDGLGERFELMRTSLKKYAACRQIHAPLDGLFTIMREHGVAADDIAEVHTRVATSMADIIDNNELPSHNAQYVLAVAAYDGRVAVDQLDGRRLEDPRIAALSARVRVSGSDELEQRFPEQWSGITTVRTNDGREFTETVYYPTGDPENALSAADLKAKFRTLSRGVVPDGRLDEIETLVAGLDSLDDCAALARCLAAGR